MPTFEATVGSNRAVTLPAELCRRLGIKQGSQVEFFLTIDGQVHFHAITGTTEGFGKVRGQVRTPPVSIREMDDGIAEHVTEKNRRILNQAKARRRKPKRAAE
jgi:AbrB family looped-hinge helix DNA binding protein